MKQQENISDQFIMQQISSGKEEVFDYIFRKYYKVLCSRAILYVKDSDIAQEIVQECFIRFWEKRSELEEVRKVYPFLSFMVRNQAIDFLRKEKMHKSVTESMKHLHQDDTADNLAISFEFEEMLMEAIHKLPGRCRQAFEYSRFEGLTYVQIAEKMDITPKAVEALIGRSLKLLRTDLIEYLPLLCVFLAHK